MPASWDAQEEHGFIAMKEIRSAQVDPEKHIEVFNKICRKIMLVNSTIENGERKFPGLLLKNPGDCGKEAQFYAAYPQAKFVFISRNPVHIMNSVFNAFYIRFETSKQMHDPYLASLVGMNHSLVTCLFFGMFLSTNTFALLIGKPVRQRLCKNVAKSVAKSFKDIRDSLSKVPPSHTIQITYQDLMNNPQQELTRIANFTGLPFNQEGLASIDVNPRSPSLKPEVQETIPFLRNLMISDGTWDPKWDEELNQ